MFAKQANKTLRDQVEDLAERIQPHVENAIEQITPVLEDARDRAGAAAGEAVHDVTTPDSPLAETDVSAEPDPKAPKV